MDINIRVMNEGDIEKVRTLWMSIKGLGIRSIDDSYEGVKKFMERNPKTSIVAEADGEIVGAILCGHDGRRGCFYHVCVREDMRRHGIGRDMATAAMRALQNEGINKVELVAFKSNEVGNRFWNGVGWKQRTDLNRYDFVLNDENITRFNEG